MIGVLVIDYCYDLVVWISRLDLCDGWFVFGVGFGFCCCDCFVELFYEGCIGFMGVVWYFFGVVFDVGVEFGVGQYFLCFGEGQFIDFDVQFVEWQEVWGVVCIFVVDGGIDVDMYGYFCVYCCQNIISS